MRGALYVFVGVLSVPTAGLVGDIVTDGKFTSTQSSGAPLQIESSDMVQNLNADMVDGIEGADIYTKAEVDALVATAAAADSRRWYYVTTSPVAGAEPDEECATGFHMASMYELLDMSNLRYDTTRGVTMADSGSGPPRWTKGWVRTGNDAEDGNYRGLANCLAWSSSDEGHYGTVVEVNQPTVDTWHSSSITISPWYSSTLTCNENSSVWCIED